MKHYFKRLANL